MVHSSSFFKQSNKHLVELGVITSAHGIKGAVKVKTFTQEPENLLAYGPLQDQNGLVYAMRILEVKTTNSLVVQIEGISNRNAAEALQGVYLYGQRDHLPPPEEDEFYHDDLIGMSAETSEGSLLGIVKSVFNFGAGDILNIRAQNGQEFFVPFRKEAVPFINLSQKRLIVEESFFELDEIKSK